MLPPILKYFVMLSSTPCFSRTSPYRRLQDIHPFLSRLLYCTKSHRIFNRIPFPLIESSHPFERGKPEGTLTLGSKPVEMHPNWPFMYKFDHPGLTVQSYFHFTTEIPSFSSDNRLSGSMIVSPTCSRISATPTHVAARSRIPTKHLLA